DWSSDVCSSDLRQKDGVTIGLGLGGMMGADITSGAWAIINNDGYIQNFVQRFGQWACNQIIGPPRWVGHYNVYGFLGKILGVDWCQEKHAHEKQQYSHYPALLAAV